MKFLIIDDDAVDRRQIGRLLRRAFPDCAIQEHDGAGTLPGGDDAAPDMVFIDYRLPGRTGLDVMDELRARWPGTPYVVMTGQGDEVIAKDSIKKGATDYLVKSSDISSEALCRMIEGGVAFARMQARIAEQQRELEIFADVLVHDLKAPIRSIGFLTEELDYCSGPDDGPRRTEVMRLLGTSAKRLGTLVDSLACHVTLTKEMTFEPARLDSLFETALTALGPQIEESGAVIDMELVDLTLLCCAPQMSQLIQNLVGNAIKYAGDKPPRITIRAREADGYLAFSVADEGIGIPREFQDRAFLPFKRASGHEGVSGTGLGLATCLKVTERHLGRIWCESEVGEGTLMHVEIPLRDELPAPAEVPGAATPGATRAAG